MMFEKGYSTRTQEIQMKWNHSFEFSINALPWRDSFAVNHFHSVCTCIIALIIIDLTDVTFRDPDVNNFIYDKISKR